MHSGHAVYQGEVGHLRVSPREYGFSYPLAHYWLDCSMLDKISLQACGIAFERFGALSFRRKDYLPGSGSVHSAARDLHALSRGIPPESAAGRPLR